jgi:hypothetical protein
MKRLDATIRMIDEFRPAIGELDDPPATIFIVAIAGNEVYATADGCACERCLGGAVTAMVAASMEDPQDGVTADDRERVH